KLILFFTSVISIFMFAIFIGGNQKNTAYAASDAVTFKGITSPTGEQIGDVNQFTQIQVNAHLQKVGFVSENDQTTVRLSSDFDFAAISKFDLKDKTGKVIANATIADKVLTLTYTAYAASISDISGDFSFIVTLAVDNASDKTSLPLNGYVDEAETPTTVATINYNKLIVPRSAINKSGGGVRQHATGC
ncbi:Ig-like domain-containing protein, partial [uncultured Secundilactobacillus sp.]